MRSIVRYFLWIIAILVAAAGTLAWWYVYRPLPQIDGTAALPGLQQDVTVDRDQWGVPHIRAGSLDDLLEAQGYVMAQDRLWQMDLLRRVARGELSEIFGPAALNVDRQYRTLGLYRAAERDAATLDPESRAAYEAYARGVNRYIEQQQNRLPLEFSLLNYKPQPWRPADSVVIAGYFYQILTDTWEQELSRAKVTERVGAERAKDLFSQESDMDRFVVGGDAEADPGANEEDDDDAPTDSVLKAESRSARPGSTPASTPVNSSALLPSDSPALLPSDSPALLPSGSSALLPSDSSAPVPDDSPAVLSGGSSAPAVGEASALWLSVIDWLSDGQSEIRSGLGSNNWVLSGAHTADGKPLLANDTHLELTMPAIWYEVHLTAPAWNVKGFTFPGAPLVVVGHNDRIAWGFTNNRADVEDLYIETFDNARPDLYRVRGEWQKARVVQETIHVKGQSDEKLAVIVTRHGPIVHREDDRAYALRWTALEPGGMAYTYNWLGRAKNWDEFRNELKRVWGPAQNAVYADVDGNIGYVMAARVPVRKKGHGEVPVPGDTDDYEWTGYIPFERLPQALNPASGLIVTANARVVGPKYKPYLTDSWEEPYRTARIYDLLADKHGLRPADMLKVQNDAYSYADLFLAQQLVAASKTAPPKDPRAQELFNRVKDWSGEAGADQPEVSFLEAAREEAWALLLKPYLKDDTKLYSWRSTAVLQKILRDRPARWLPAEFKSYDELLAAAADRAVERLERRSGKRRVADWPWRRFNSLAMLHVAGRAGLLRRLLSITDKPQNGTITSVRAAQPHHGPAMRFVADLGNWDESLMQIPGGESGQVGSGHYKDQFAYWYEGKPILASFSDAAQERTRRHRLTLKPGS